MVLLYDAQEARTQSSAAAYASRPQPLAEPRRDDRALMSSPRPSLVMQVGSFDKLAAWHASNAALLEAVETKLILPLNADGARLPRCKPSRFLATTSGLRLPPENLAALRLPPACSCGGFRKDRGVVPRGWHRVRAPCRPWHGRGDGTQNNA